MMGKLGEGNRKMMEFTQIYDFASVFEFVGL
jgi:hypothetical protein